MRSVDDFSNVQISEFFFLCGFIFFLFCISIWMLALDTLCLKLIP